MSIYNGWTAPVTIDEKIRNLADGLRRYWDAREVARVVGEVLAHHGVTPAAVDELETALRMAMRVNQVNK